MSRPAPHPRRRGAALLLGVMSICALLYAVRLDGIAFLGKDEPKNAQAAREMLLRGDWVTTTLAGEPWYDKPILYYWTALVGYHVLGVGELGARAGPALAALSTVLLTFLLGRRVLKDASVAALAALVLGTGLEFWYFARTAVTDSLLTACVTGSLVAYVFARDGVRPRLNLHLAYASAGAAALAKGPIGIVLPAMVIATDQLLTRPAARLRSLHLLTGGAVAAAVAGPWYALVLLRSDGRFFHDFILHFNVDRFAGTGDLPHEGPIYYYIPFLLMGPFPWSVFLPTGLIRLAQSLREMIPEDRRHYRTLLLWMGLPLALFSVAGSKLPSYLLPTFPALAVILAREIRELMRMPGKRIPPPLAVVVVVFALASAGIVAGALSYFGQHDAPLLGAVAPLCIVLAACAAGALLSLLLRQRSAAAAWLGLSAVLAPLTVVEWALPPMERYASARAISRQAMSLRPAPGGLLSYRFYDNSFFFYTESRVERLWERRWVEDRVEELGEALCFVRRPDLPEIHASSRFRAEDLGREGELHLLRLTAAGEPPSP